MTVSQYLRYNTFLILLVILLDQHVFRERQRNTSMAQKYPRIPKIDIRANKKFYGKDIDSTSLRESPLKK